MEEFMQALGEAKELLSDSEVLRRLKKEMTDGKRSSLTRQEFEEAMRDLYFNQYRDFFESVPVAAILAKAMLDNLNHPLLKDECKSMKPLASLKKLGSSQLEQVQRGGWKFITIDG
jgi:hypothetical protein